MNLKNKNKGFSLIELIVTIALMAIITGAAVSIYSFINTHRLEKLAENTSDCISDVRTNAMSKSKEYCLVVRKEDDDFVGAIYYLDGTKWTELDKKTIGSVGKIDVNTTLGNENISGTKGLIIKFNKSGSLSDMKVVDMTVGDADTYIEDSGSSTISYKINISHANRERTISIAKITGKHYIEK